MINYKTWKESIGLPITSDGDTPSAEDYEFYKTKLFGKTKYYFENFLNELQKGLGKMNTPKKGFILQEVIEALDLTPQQVTKFANNIKSGLSSLQTAQSKTPQSNLDNSNDFLK